MEKLGSADPQRIGGYRLLGRLGAGGMGQVFLARSERGRTVAIKLVRPELAEQQRFRERFRAEVRAARRVGGAWTAPVLDADTDAAVPWVATGYVAGPSLHRVVSGHPGVPADRSGSYGPLPEHSVRALGSGLAGALQDIHRAGIVHRDLKPSNVLVTIDGPRVIDFGIARALETLAEGDLTRTGSLVGSPGFMAPEQVRGERVTTACDVFCLGSVLAYAATGRMPFGAADSGVHALMFRIAREEPDLTGVPVDLVELIQDCLVKDPAARPSTDSVLERLGSTDSAEPWLPAALIAQLGRHAVELLDSEDPEEDGPAEDGPEDGGPAAPVAGAAGAPTTTGAPAPLGAPATPAPPSPPVTTAAPGTSAPPAASAPGTVPVRPPSAPGPAPIHAPGPPATPPPPPPYGHSGQQPLPPPYGHPGQQPPPPSYGYPQQAPPPSPYGYATQPAPGHTGGFGPTRPYGPPPHPAPGSAPSPSSGPRGRRRGAAVLLVVVAALVAAGACWGVYAFMKDDGGTTASPSPTASSSGGSSADPAPRNPDPTGSGSGDGTGGAVPADYVGTWTGTVGGDAGTSTRRLVIRQGEVGDTVLSLTADGPLGSGGSYHCVFQAELADGPAPGDPVRIGPSRVTVGEPAASCTPGRPTVLTLLPDGGLRREIPETGESLTYTRTD
ncbi:serine/threonine protein kinase [Streptomyces nitrosporeus]|uniref:Serine/threonine protein kinase n=1 Tax=Streptomyces nitrosporeus TaxID=28894 RepID=A0A5J6FFG1_9ACTN|nr:serine/threonine-protein kinase [Streptomyces nitrosporeus]QEU73690.1 serine/threonine protein kinase [Streptomyces nitrosporeus]GGZ12042.1 hypothetical protein GCM10010327_48640 [Streptomyces nitrosporeus]